MYCPKCGKENIEGAQLCSSCSWVLTSTSTGLAPDVKISRSAIAALVLGILAPFTLFLTTLPAIICGIIALVKINKSRGQLKGNGLAIAGIAIPVVVLPIVAMITAIMIPTLSRTRMAEQIRNVIEGNIDSRLYGIVFTTGMTDSNVPKNDLQQISLNEKCLYIFMKWRLSLKNHYYTVKISDSSGEIIYETKYYLAPTQPTWRTWPSYFLIKYIDKPGRWKVEVYLDGQKVGEKFLTVVAEEN